MDPATIFQTVGVAVELVITTQKIISAGSDIYKNGRRNMPLNESREHAMQDLKQLNDSLITEYGKVPTAALSEEGRRKLEMCRNCNQIAEEILEALRKLQVQGERRSKRESLSVALKSVWNESDIEDKKKRLEEYRSQLTTGFVMDTYKSMEKQAAATAELDGKLADLSERFQNLDASTRSRHDVSTAQSDLIIDSLNQFRADFQTSFLKPQIAMTSHKRSPSQSSNRSIDGFTLVDTEGVVASQQSIHEVVEEGDRGALYDLLDENVSAVRAKNGDGQTPLHIAVLSSNEKIVQDLIGKGARIDDRDKQLSTPLHYAAAAGNVRIVRKLVAAGADPKLENKNDKTPWHLARDHPEIQWVLRTGAGLEARNSNHETAIVHFTRQGDLQVVSSLLDQGAYVSAHGDSGQTALIEAVWQNNYEMTKLLLDHDNKPYINETNARGDTPLGAHCQVDEDPDIRIFDMLMEARPDIHCKNDCDFNPAFEAAAHGQTEQLKKLIELGADLDLFEVGGHSPLIRAAEQNRALTVEILLSTGKSKVDGYSNMANSNVGRTALSYACQLGHIEVVKTLMKHGADVNLADKSFSNYSPLHQAAIHQHKEVVRELLNDKTIDLDIASKQGWRPISEAAVRDDYDIAKLLLEAGADPNVIDDTQVTPLVRAVQQDSAKVTELLLDHRARIDATDNLGHTALLVCAWENYLNAARVLLKRGAYVRAASREKGYTALCAASLKGHTDMVKLLLEHGASAQNEANIDYWTPLHEAAAYGRYELSLLLLEHGANPLARNSRKQGARTPLAFAAERDNVKMVKLMCTFIND